MDFFCSFFLLFIYGLLAACISPTCCPLFRNALSLHTSCAVFKMVDFFVVFVVVSVWINRGKYRCFRNVKNMLTYDCEEVQLTQHVAEALLLVVISINDTDQLWVPLLDNTQTRSTDNRWWDAVESSGKIIIESGVELRWSCSYYFFYFFFNQSLSTTDLIAFLFFSLFCPTPLTYTVFFVWFFISCSLTLLSYTPTHLHQIHCSIRGELSVSRAIFSCFIMTLLAFHLLPSCVLYLFEF